jgi:transaldolase
MAKTTLHKLAENGQSVWLDYISRSLIDTGKLKGMIDLGVGGLTSNPSIFDKAISNSRDYDDHIQELHKTHRSTFEIYDDLTIKDIQDAADIFKPVYENTDGIDGFVSLEINPELSYNIEETITEGRRLFQKVDRSNLLLKVPATESGFKAIENLLAQGINVNVTLIFSQQQYYDTTKAYIKGLKKFIANNGDASRLSSVASVFVSRVDTLTDKLLEEKGIKELDALKGRAAVANAHLIYNKYQEIFSGPEFKELHKKDARVQRLLWGSTSTKNPAYSDIKYVAELIGENTINTIPEKTLYAFLDHGIVKRSLGTEIDQYQETLNTLKTHGIDIDLVCKKLLDDGVIAFQRSFASLIDAISNKAKKL